MKLRFDRKLKCIVVIIILFSLYQLCIKIAIERRKVYPVSRQVEIEELKEKIDANLYIRR